MAGPAAAQHYTMWTSLCLVMMGSFSLLLLLTGTLAVQDQYRTVDLAVTWVLLMGLLSMVVEMPTIYIIGKLCGERWLLAYSKPASLFSMAFFILALKEAASARGTLKQQEFSLTIWFAGLVSTGVTCFVAMSFHATLSDVYLSLKEADHTEEQESIASASMNYVGEARAAVTPASSDSIRNRPSSFRHQNRYHHASRHHSVRSKLGRPQPYSPVAANTEMVTAAQIGPYAVASSETLVHAA